MTEKAKMIAGDLYDASDLELKGLPHAYSKSGAANIQRKAPTGLRVFEQADHLGDKLFVVSVAADEFRVRKVELNFHNELLGVIAKRSGANAFFSRRHQHGPQRTFTDRKANCLIRTTVAIILWLHTEYFA